MPSEHRDAPRRTLPNRRRNNTFPVQIPDLNVAMLMTVGYFPDGKPAEVFVSDVKAGSTMDAVARDAAVILSIALQHNVPLEAFKKSVTRNANSEPSSVMGALIDKLVAEKIEPDELPQASPPEPDPAPVGPMTPLGGLTGEATPLPEMTL